MLTPLPARGMTYRPTHLSGRTEFLAHARAVVCYVLPVRIIGDPVVRAGQEAPEGHKGFETFDLSVDSLMIQGEDVLVHAAYPENLIAI